MAQPTLLYGVGATKAGTSWLYTYLEKHTQTGIQPFKEMHFWEFAGAMPRKHAMEAVERDIARASANYQAAKKAGDTARMKTTSRNASAFWGLLNLHNDPTEARYLRLLSQGAGGKRIIADFTPAYAMADVDTLNRMQGVNRATKFIYLMRDPVDRLWSHLRMIAGRNKPLTEAKMVKAFNDWADGKNPGVVARSDYAGALARLQKAVPKENLFIGYYEEVTTQSGVDAVCDFLGLDPMKGDFDTRVWASAAVDMPGDLLARAHQALRPHYDAAATAMGRVPDTWRTDLQGAAV